MDVDLKYQLTVFQFHFMWELLINIKSIGTLIACLAGKDEPYKQNFVSSLAIQEREKPVRYNINIYASQQCLKKCEIFDWFL